MHVWVWVYARTQDGRVAGWQDGRMAVPLRTSPVMCAMLSLYAAVPLLSFDINGAWSNADSDAFAASTGGLRLPPCPLLSDPP